MIVQVTTAPRGPPPFFPSGGLRDGPATCPSNPQRPGALAPLASALFFADNAAGFSDFWPPSRRRGAYPPPPPVFWRSVSAGNCGNQVGKVAKNCTFFRLLEVLDRALKPDGGIFEGPPPISPRDHLYQFPASAGPPPKMKGGSRLGISIFFIFLFFSFQSTGWGFGQEGRRAKPSPSPPPPRQSFPCRSNRPTTFLTFPSRGGESRPALKPIGFFLSVAPFSMRPQKLESI